MAGEPEIQLSRLLDERGLSSFQIRVLAWSILIAIIDGYDIAAISFAAPHLVSAWGVERGALGPVLSASNFGFLFGAAILGWFGDRYGRKAALITASLLFGVFTFAAAYATDLTQLFWLRLVAGLGIGGVIPNVVAINAESAPRSLRATLAIVAMSRLRRSSGCRNRSNTWRSTTARAKECNGSLPRSAPICRPMHAS
jgi:MFS transporter, AAHS family, 4-hydroxybenzoate transporter